MTNLGSWMGEHIRRFDLFETRFRDAEKKLGGFLRNRNVGKKPHVSCRSAYGGLKILEDSIGGMQSSIESMKNDDSVSFDHYAKPVRSLEAHLDIAERTMESLRSQMLRRCVKAI